MKKKTLQVFSFLENSTPKSLEGGHLLIYLLSKIRLSSLLLPLLPLLPKTKKSFALLWKCRSLPHSLDLVLPLTPKEIVQLSYVTG
jgi:hypothetical protein